MFQFSQKAKKNPNTEEIDMKCKIGKFTYTLYLVFDFLFEERVKFL